MGNRIERWKKLGYTDEQIQNHLNFERYKAKKVRDRRKKNNEQNKDLIKKIQKLIGKDFVMWGDKIKVLSISPSVDGDGFWYRIHKIFRDGSGGDFRGFFYFKGYNTKEFIELL
jgi:hypothetical protein